MKTNLQRDPATRRHDLRNVVLRHVCDSSGVCIGIVIQPHDGTEAGLITAARRATRRMYLEYAEPSNVESRIAATDDTGKLRWCISPNFQHLAEIGTDEASYIWGYFGTEVR